MADIFKTDQVLWYNNGIWGELGFAAPNFGDDGITNNATIDYMVKLIGRNVQAIMCTNDVDLRTPPSINTLTKIHRLIIRARQVIGGRAVPPGTPDFESIHVNPGLREFQFFPCPYFKVRNPFLGEYAGLALACLSEICQHTENRKPNEISVDFGAMVGNYLSRIYRRMATELFGVDPAAAAAPAFLLTEEQLASYDPSKFFTSTELIDTVPVLTNVWTEDDLQPLSDGIYSSQIKTFLQKFPGGASVIDGRGQGDGKSGGSTITVPAFPQSGG